MATEQKVSAEPASQTQNQVDSHSTRMATEEGPPEPAHNSKVVDRRTSKYVWKSKTQYMMTQLGFSVGLGSIWRFPSLCQQFEALGQNFRSDVWRKIHPRLGSVGLTCSLITFLLIIYYNIFIAWSILYLRNSFMYPLPWTECPKWTVTSIPDSNCTRATPSVYFWYGQTLHITNRIDDSGGIVLNIGICLLVVWLFLTVISIQDSNTKGKILYFSVIVPYVILFCFLIRSYLMEGSIYGLRKLVKTKISALFSPILWWRAGTQVFFNLGCGCGGLIVLSSFLKMNTNCAQDAFILVFANLASSLLAAQVVFSVLGFRAATFVRECVNQSYWKLMELIRMRVLPIEVHPPENLMKMPVRAFNMWLNHFNDDLRLQVLEHVPDCKVEEELVRNTEGPGLLYMAFTEAIAKFPDATLWSIIFFLMLINLALSSSMGLMQTIQILLQDTFPWLHNSSLTISVTIGCLGFLFSLLFSHHSGLYFLNLFDDFIGTVALCTMILFENIAVAWIYGAKRFMNEVRDCMGFKVWIMHEFLLRYVTLLVIIIIFICYLLSLGKHPTYTAWDWSTFEMSETPYPEWALILGISLIILIMLPTLVGLLCFKKSVILPLPRNSSPQPLEAPKASSSLQDQQASSSGKTGSLFEVQAAEAQVQ
ncbi:orphan sodium- and chloride-dependent neurotransmitter transporter NTT5 isoform X2 [Macrotis lagotis]|uniref:orphan sodium- and chloride-dependent neurotransmitter transporter NTT5 isoform X2 n=1 Tax=Macrotis lagotis TaxID=92651 RepID=UPI003D68FE6E